MTFTRYGVYFTPSDARFAQAGAAWLGWDIVSAKPLVSPFPNYTSRPRKYGYHATLKPPFRLAENQTETKLLSGVRDMARNLSPVELGRPRLSRIGSFFAWTCAQPNYDLQELAAHVVEELDAFRAPITEDDIKRRLRPGMPEAQIRNLKTWGYPYVMEEFRFHITLTGPTPKSEADHISTLIEDHFSSCVPDQLTLDALTVVGEQEDGQFAQIARVPLELAHR